MTNNSPSLCDKMKQEYTYIVILLFFPAERKYKANMHKSSHSDFIGKRSAFAEYQNEIPIRTT